MSKLEIKLNSAGVRELLQSADMMSVCEQHARSAAARLGPGYEVSTYTGKTRVNAQISAVTAEARRENAEQNTIIKALR